jgi:hypothetical protein
MILTVMLAVVLQVEGVWDLVDAIQILLAAISSELPIVGMGFF